MDIHCLVSYGGATEDMKLAICFRHEYMWFTYSIDLRTCRMRIDRSTYEDYAFNQNISGWNTSHHVSYTPAGETGSKIKSI